MARVRVRVTVTVRVRVRVPVRVTPREVGEGAAAHDDPTAAAADGEGVGAPHVAEAAAEEAHVAARADGDGAPRLTAVWRARRVLQHGRLDLDVPAGRGGLAGRAVLEGDVLEGVAAQPTRLEEHLLEGHPRFPRRRRRAAKGAVEHGRARGVELAWLGLGLGLGGRTLTLTQP